MEHTAWTGGGGVVWALVGVEDTAWTGGRGAVWAIGGDGGSSIDSQRGWMGNAMWVVRVTAVG